MQIPKPMITRKYQVLYLYFFTIVFATFPKDAVPVKELCQDIANRASEGLRPVHPGTIKKVVIHALGYFAFVPGGGIPLCAVANLVSDLINRFTVC